MALAIFDLDNTLIAGDSDHSWGEFLIDQKKVNQSEYRAMNDKFLADYEAERLDISAYLEFSLSPLINMATTELNQLHEKFMTQVIEPMKLSQANELIEKHRQSGDRLLVITATNRLVVEPIISSFGIDEFLATDPEIISGRVTGKVIGTPTFREGKVERLKDWLTENNESLEGSYFYSDSINDLPLLQEVDHPVAVDPDDALHRESERRGWPIISLRN